jgi:hypothetical protein
MQNDAPYTPAIRDAIANAPASTLILLALAAGIWVIGGHILVAFHYRRLGQPMWTGLKPFRVPFLKFNAKEWMILVLLAVVSLTLASVGLDLQGR